MCDIGYLKRYLCNLYRCLGTEYFGFKWPKEAKCRKGYLISIWQTTVSTSENAQYIENKTQTIALQLQRPQTLICIYTILLYMQSQKLLYWRTFDSKNWNLAHIFFVMIFPEYPVLLRWLVAIQIVCDKHTHIHPPQKSTLPHTQSAPQHLRLPQQHTLKQRSKKNKFVRWAHSAAKCTDPWAGANATAVSLSLQLKQW